MGMGMEEGSFYAEKCFTVVGKSRGGNKVR